MVGTALVTLGCGGASSSDDGMTVEHRYSLDTSKYYPTHDDMTLFIANENLTLPLDGASATLTEAMPGSLERVYTRRYCDPGQLPSDIPNFESAHIPAVPSVHLTKVSVSFLNDGNDLATTPSFSVRSSDGSWSACVVADHVAAVGMTRSASLGVDVTDANAVAIFPSIYANIFSIDYTTHD
jgi:hypothetical protein